MKTIVAAALLAMAGTALPLAAGAQACGASPRPACLVDPALLVQSNANAPGGGVSFLRLSGIESAAAPRFDSAAPRHAAGVAGERMQEATAGAAPPRSADGAGYRRVGLSLEETGLNSMLSLDPLRVLGSAAGDAPRSPAAGTLVDDLHGLAANWVLLTGALSARAPDQASRWFYLPDALVSQSHYLYLNSLFGERAAGSRPFNWLALPASAFAVPEPSTAWLLALGFLALVVLRRTRYAAAL
jgi:PEP-CTERM motif-containing protein